MQGGVYVVVYVYVTGVSVGAAVSADDGVPSPGAGDVVVAGGGCVAGKVVYDGYIAAWCWCWCACCWC